MKPLRVWLGQYLCGLTRHQYLLHFDRARVALECSNCGHTTPGWKVGKV